MRDLHPTLCDPGSTQSIRLTIEGRAVAKALKRYVTAQNAIVDRERDGYVDRAIYEHGRLIWGLVVIKARLGVAEKVYLSAPGAYFSPSVRPILEDLAARIASHHGVELVTKDALQDYAIGPDGHGRRIKVRPRSAEKSQQRFARKFGPGPALAIERSSGGGATA